MDINDIAAKAAAKIDAARDTKVNAVKTAAASGVEVQEAARLLVAAEQKYARTTRPPCAPTGLKPTCAASVSTPRPGRPAAVRAAGKPPRKQPR
jgi:hypothetical protein